MLPFCSFRIKSETAIMSYKNLMIWEIANEIVLEIHEMTIHDLPKFEMFETGSQIRRSSKSIKSNIVEGYGRRGYQQEFIHFLTIALGSTLETADHLETLSQTKSLTDVRKYKELEDKLDKLGRMINLFIQTIRDRKSTRS